MIGVVVSEDDERKAVARLFHHVLHAFVDTADIGRVHAAIDKDMSGAILSRDCQKEKITEPDAVHPHADVGGVAGGRWLCGGLWRWFRGSNARPGGVPGRRGFFLGGLSRCFSDGFSGTFCGSFACSHD